MNTNTNNLPQDVEKMIAEENKMMCVFITLIIGILIGLGIGYCLFVQFPWHF